MLYHSLLSTQCCTFSGQRQQQLTTAKEVDDNPVYQEVVGQRIEMTENNAYESAYHAAASTLLEEQVELYT